MKLVCCTDKEETKWYISSCITCAFQWLEKVVLYTFIVNTVFVICYNDKTDFFPYLMSAPLDTSA